MSEDESLLKNRTEHEPGPDKGEARPAWAIMALASVLIFTTVVDVLGNLLVIVAVLRNRKLRNVGKKLKAIFIHGLSGTGTYMCACVSASVRTAERQTQAEDHGAQVIIHGGLRRNDIQR